MNTPPRRFIVLVVCVVVATAGLMAPRRDEWLAIMRDEDKQAQIIALLEPRLARTGNDPDLLATLGRSYAEIGNFQRAAELFERYVVLRPDDGGAYARLADLYKSTGNTAKRIAMLQRSLAIKPRLSRATELSGLYRAEQRAAEELALLARHESELTLEGGFLLRLAQLRAGNGDREGAIETLMRPEIISAAPRPNQSQEERIFLGELLARAGRSAELVRLGKLWIVQWHEPWLAGRLLRILASLAPAADASDYAEAVAVLHPEVRFFLVRGLAQAGATPVARHLLATWSKANPSPTMNDIAAFLFACREHDQPAIVWQAFSATLNGPSSTEVVARYSDAIAAEFGIGALAPFWSSLPTAVIDARPLLAARLAFHERDPGLAKWLLGKVDLTKLETSDRRMWMDLLAAVAPPPEVFAVLRGQRGRGGLPRDLMAEYVRLAAGLGQELEYRAALVDLRRME